MRNFEAILLSFISYIDVQFLELFAQYFKTVSSIEIKNIEQVRGLQTAVNPLP
jgi:hypothetical protein